MLLIFVMALATVEPTPPATLSLLEQYGPGGSLAAVMGVAVTVLFRNLIKTLELERAGRTRAEDEVRELNKAIHERYIPSITTFMAEAAKLTAATAEATRVLDSVRRGER